MWEIVKKVHFPQDISRREIKLTSYHDGRTVNDLVGGVT